MLRKYFWGSKKVVLNQIKSSVASRTQSLLRKHMLHSLATDKTIRRIKVSETIVSQFLQAFPVSISYVIAFI